MKRINGFTLRQTVALAWQAHPTWDVDRHVIYLLAIGWNLAELEDPILDISLWIRYLMKGSQC